MRIRWFVVVLVTALVVVFASPIAAGAKSVGLSLHGAITFVDESGSPVLFPSSTCASVADDYVAKVRVGGSKASVVTAELERSVSPLSFDQDHCRLSFSTRLPRGNTYILSVGGVRFGRWTATELAEREGWVFIDLRGGSTSRSWRATERAQYHEQVPVPDNTEPINGTPFDPVAWQMAWTTIPGTANEQECATVGNGTSVRAGSIIAGNFASYRAGWNGTVAQSKLWYMPLDPAGRPPLTVVAQRLDPAGNLVGNPVPVLGDHGAAWTPAGHFFYATSTLLPERGSWRMTVTAGANRGCFDFGL